MFFHLNQFSYSQMHNFPQVSHLIFFKSCPDKVSHISTHSSEIGHGINLTKGFWEFMWVKVREPCNILFFGDIFCDISGVDWCSKHRREEADSTGPRPNDASDR